MRLRKYIRGWRERRRQRFDWIARRTASAAAGGEDVLAAERIWVKRPPDLSGRRVCLFVTYSAKGSVARHVQHHARAWADNGYAVILVIALDDLQLFNDDPALEFCSSILLRHNEGWDFAAWATCLRSITSLRDAAAVALVNDSIFGPLAGFDSMLKRMEQSRADVIGLIENREYQPHLQSFVLLIKRRALQNPAFWEFWNGVLTKPKQAVIDEYEIPFSSIMKRAGIRCASLFRTPRSADPVKRNPTLGRWRELVRTGFPYVKVQLLRDNPNAVDLTNWEEFVRQHGFDPQLAKEHLIT